MAIKRKPITGASQYIGPRVPVDPSTIDPNGYQGPGVQANPYDEQALQDPTNKFGEAGGTKLVGGGGTGSGDFGTGTGTGDFAPVDPKWNAANPGSRTGRQQNAESAKGALAKLLQTQQDSPEARAANAANLKSKAAQATLAQKANVGARGMTASGFGASQVAGQERLGGQAVSKGMTAYDMDRRQEEQARKTSTMGMIGGLQRNEFEAEAFLRAQAELNQGERTKDIGTVITVADAAGKRATIVSAVPPGGTAVGKIQKVNGKEYQVYRTKEGDMVAVQQTSVDPRTGRAI